MAFRYDTGSLRPAEQLADGRLRVDGHLTRTGVFHYRNADGSVRKEYRPDSEVFRGASLESFADVPVTNDHPPVMLTAETNREHTVGFVSGAPKRDGDHVKATMVLLDAATIARVRAGKVELSCGYECDVDETPGLTPDGERYDAVQTNIRGNHVAIVEVARAGRSARMRIDAADMVENPAPNRTEYTMDPKDAAKLIADLAVANARADKAEADLKAAQAAHEAAIATVTARADNADRALATERQARTDAAATERDRVRARIKLEDVAAKHLGAEFKCDGLDDNAVRAAVVAKLQPERKLDGKHEAYVEAVFEDATKAADEADAAVAGLRVAAEGGRTDSAPTGAGSTGEAAKARAEMLERNANAHKAK